MPPIRRYLRITPYTVLLVHIYLDAPSLAQNWLLHPSHPVLPRIIQSIKPLILPKLREENDRSTQKKGTKKKKGVKDTVVEDDFEVSIFLTDLEGRHTLLRRQKNFQEKPLMRSNSTKLLGEEGAAVGNAIQVNDNIPMIEREDDELNLEDIPAASGPNSEEEDDDDDVGIANPSKRRRRFSESLFIDDGGDSPEAKRSKLGDGGVTEEDDKKKLAMDMTYDGFSIYGKALCLIVKRRDLSGRKVTVGQAMMEEWISATQMPPEDIG